LRENDPEYVDEEDEEDSSIEVGLIG